MDLHLLNEYLGPALGFLCTLGVILFIAFGAHKTARPLDPGHATPETPAPSASETGESGEPVEKAQ